MAKKQTRDAEQAARHWKSRAEEYQRLGRRAEALMAEALAASFERARAQRFTSDFALVVDGRPVYAEIDGRPVDPKSFPRRR